jgi:hypothetical protein
MVTFAMVDAAVADTGLASGLTNTANQLGGALGLAVLASISSTRSTHLLAAGSSVPEALSGGYRLAFLVAACCTAVCCVLAASIFGGPKVGTTRSVEEQATMAMYEAEVGI